MTNNADGLDGLNEASGYADVPKLDAGVYLLKPIKHEMGGQGAVKTFISKVLILESTSTKANLQPGCVARIPIWGFGDMKRGPIAQRQLKAYLCAVFADIGLTPESKADFVGYARKTIADAKLIHHKAPNGERTIKVAVEVAEPKKGPDGRQVNPAAQPYQVYSWL